MHADAIIYSRVLTTSSFSQANGHCSPISNVCETEHENSLMTHSQRRLCKQHPKLFGFLLSPACETTKNFLSQCRNQFKHEKWNCENITYLPLSGTVQPFLTLGELRSYTLTTHAGMINDNDNDMHAMLMKLASYTWLHLLLWYT